MVSLACFAVSVVQAHVALSAAVVETGAGGGAGSVAEEPAVPHDILVGFAPLVRAACALHGAVAPLVAAADAFLAAVGLLADSA